MADSCRPVSRHGRYHAADRRLSSNVPYTEDVPSYSTLEYVDQDGKTIAILCLSHFDIDICPITGPRQIDCQK